MYVWARCSHQQPLFEVPLAHVFAGARKPRRNIWVVHYCDTSPPAGALTFTCLFIHSTQCNRCLLYRNPQQRRCKQMARSTLHVRGTEAYRLVRSDWRMWWTAAVVSGSSAQRERPAPGRLSCFCNATFNEGMAQTACQRCSNSPTMVYSYYCNSASSCCLL